ncbi:MAG: hypothetical protein HY553_01385 [Elusimicrobia bacterium]|nr:hypothetical protein [Elusimicrobiota bacterium]
MAWVESPGISDADLAVILKELDGIVFPERRAGASSVPPAPAAASDYKLPAVLELGEAPPPPPPKPAPQAAPPPPPAPPRPAAPPSGASEAPADAPPEQVRRIAVLCSTDCVAEVAALMSYLQEIGRKVAKPIFLSCAFVREVDAQTSPDYVAIKTRAADAVAAILVSRDCDDVKREAWTAAMGKKRVHFHHVEPAAIRQRVVLVDIMTDLLVIDPGAFTRVHSWEGARDDHDHGIRQ